MKAADILRKFAERDIIISLDGEDLAITNFSRLTDEEKHYIKCYKKELLWRLRHPEGDPDTRDYKVYKVQGVSLGQLADEGNAIMERENIPPSKIFDPELYAASIALSVEFYDGTLIEIPQMSTPEDWVPQF